MFSVTYTESDWFGGPIHQKGVSRLVHLGYCTPQRTPISWNCEVC
jgi:hypothetical protein